MFRQSDVIGVPRGEVPEIVLAEQDSFGMTGGTRRVERHARRLAAWALAHQRQPGVRLAGIDASDVEPGHLIAQGVLTIVQQQHCAGVLQDVLLTLQGMAGFEWQVHRTTAESRQNAGEQRAGFRQTNAHHNRPVNRSVLLDQWQQALLNGQALGVQVAIAEHLTGNVQRRAFTEGLEALFKPLDHRDLPELQQRCLPGEVKSMGVGQAFQREQVLLTLMPAGRGSCGECEVLGITGKTTDFKRNTIDQFGDDPQA